MCNLMKMSMPGVYPLGQAVDALKKTYWGFFNARFTWPHEIHLTAYSKEFAYVIMIMISFLHATFYSYDSYCYHD